MSIFDDVLKDIDKTEEEKAAELEKNPKEKRMFTYGEEFTEKYGTPEKK